MCLMVSNMSIFFIQERKNRLTLANRIFLFLYGQSVFSRDLHLTDNNNTEKMCSIWCCIVNFERQHIVRHFGFYEYQYQVIESNECLLCVGSTQKGYLSWVQLMVFIDYLWPTVWRRPAGFPNNFYRDPMLLTYKKFFIINIFTLPYGELFASVILQWKCSSNN